MDDSISRQAAIDAMAELQGRASTKAELKGISKAWKRIKQLPSAQPNQQWIPCKERLPEEEKKRYWVCTDTEYQCECRWTNNRFGMGELDEWGWSIFDIPQYSHVTAWMPLPKPWKGET